MAKTKKHCTKTRRQSCIFLGSVKYPNVSALYRDETDELVRQAPTGITVLGRVNFLTNTFHQGGNRVTRDEAYVMVAKELSSFWIYGLNIYPKCESSVASLIKKEHDNMRKLQKYNPKKKESDIEKYNSKQQHGFDILTETASRRKQLENEYDIKMQKEEFDLYEDNCKKKKECSCSWTAKIKCKDCPRQMISSDAVDKKWQAWLKRKQETDRKKEEASRKAKEESEIYKRDSSVHHKISDPEMSDNEYYDEYHHPASPSQNKPLYTNFPKIPLRFTKKELKPDIMHAFTATKCLRERLNGLR